MSFTQLDYSNLIDRLHSLADDKYRQFHKKLIPGEQTNIGVRSPQLKKIAAELKTGDWRGFIALSKDDFYEERVLQGLVIAGAKMDIDERLQLAEAFIPNINNWAVCDSFCSAFKPARQELIKIRSFIAPYLLSNDEYHVRFGAVMLLCHFINEEYIDSTLSDLTKISHPGYYAKMAVAWAISVCFVKFRDKTLPIISGQGLEPFIQNKSIQKIRESYRVDPMDKQMLLQYKL